MSNENSLNSFQRLTETIEQTHWYFQNQVQKQVNVALTIRNWLIGGYIVNYEQNGADRAEYGKALIHTLSANLKQRNLKGFSEIALRLNRTFYLTYPSIQQTVSVNSYTNESLFGIIQQTASVELDTTRPNASIPETTMYLLISKLANSPMLIQVK
jgi:hypothetical protein